jgi:glycosyltransferase involved in cell wall biosynthesis
MSISLSIVIPTKNRKIYLDHFIKWFLPHEFEDVELIVQDNSDAGPDEEYIDLSSQHNLFRYYHHNGELSAVENCDRAVRRAKGEFVCFIGDDDGITVSLVKFVRSIISKPIESVGFELASYSWPDMVYRRHGDSMSGVLTRERNNKFEIKRVNIDEQLKKLLNNGGRQLTKIPKLYHGIVRRTVLKELHKDCGTYFPGPVPDMTNAVALTKYVTNHYTVNQPLIITGNGGLSMAGEGAKGTHHGSISGEKTLPVSTEKNWSKKIPMYWSPETIWGESVHKALEATDRQGLLKSYNYTILYAYCLSFNAQYYKIILNCIAQNYSIIGYLSTSLKIGLYCVKIFTKRVIIFIENKSKASPSSENKHASNITTIPEAISIIENELSFNMNKEINSFF